MTPSRFRQRHTLPPRTAFALLATTILTLLASSSAPTPLYATYQARWDFSDWTITVIFGVYALAVLGSLLVAGSLSDHIGRRPILAVALVAQALVMVIFATADGVEVLLVARVLQGLATGAALGAIGAGLVDLHPGHGPLANSVAALAGTGTGALGSALLVQLLPAPTELVYVLLAALFVIQAVGIGLSAETSPRVPGARASLRPVLGVPPAVRGALLIATPSLVAAWALAGFYASLGPSLTGLVADTHSAILGGGSLFVLAVSGSVTVLALRGTEPRRLALVGSLLMVAGVGVVLWSVVELSAVGFYLGTVLAGSGVGAGFQGSLRTIVATAEPHERASVISVAYVISYLALGLPAVLAGALVVHGTVTHTAEGFAAAVIVLAGLTAAGLVMSARRGGAAHRAAIEPAA